MVWFVREMEVERGEGIFQKPCILASNIAFLSMYFVSLS